MIGVKGSPAPVNPLNHLLACVRYATYLLLGIPRSKKGRTVSVHVKDFSEAFFVFFTPSGSPRRFVLPFVQKKVNKTSASCWCPHPLLLSFTTCSQRLVSFLKMFVTWLLKIFIHKSARCRQRCSSWRWRWFNHCSTAVQNVHNPHVH